MKRIVLVVAVLVFTFLVGVSFAEETNVISVKAGDEINVCGCGKGCDCDTMSTKTGKCVCGKPMVKGKVANVVDGKAAVKMGKEEQLFKTAGLYYCGCGKGCDCNTISQKPGKCVCGKPLQQAKAKQ